MSVGANISELRKREHLTQAQLAAALGVTKETVCRWERGKSAIRNAHVQRLCELYSISSDDILSESTGLFARESFKRDVHASGTANDTVSRDAIPVYEIRRSARGTALYAKGTARTPFDVAERHPKSAFIKMTSRDMNLSYPMGSLLLVDPSIKPFNGCTVVATIDESDVLIRKYCGGNNLVMLSTNSHSTSSPDLTLDKRRVRFTGVVVWFQADHDLTA